MHYETILTALHRSEMRYLVVGGLAVNLHGIPRLTVDLDIIIDLSDENIRIFLATVKTAGYKPKLPVNPDDLLDVKKRYVWIKERNLIAFTFVKEASNSEELDVVLDYPMKFEDAYKNRVVLETENYEIPLIAIDDLQAMKLNTGRAQDESDIEMLGRVKLDLENE